MEDIQKNQVGIALFLSAYIHQGDDLFSAQLEANSVLS